MKWEDFIKPKPTDPDFTVALDPATTITNREIHDFFRAAGMTEEGTDGFMGNLAWESDMNPQNVEDRSGFRDEDYTWKVDNDPTYDFVTDNGNYFGYGYAQWTDSKRKGRLLAYARANGKSIGDSLMQLQFSVLELQTEFPMVFLTLCTSHDLYECTKVVCEKYENPKVWNTGDRYKLAQQFYNEFAGSGALADAHAAQAPTVSTTDACPIFPPDPSVMVIQMVMTYNGYWDKPDGYKSPEFFSALREFTSDMEKC